MIEISGLAPGRYKLILKARAQLRGGVGRR
jgi:hypothetical protein